MFLLQFYNDGQRQSLPLCEINKSNGAVDHQVISIGRSQGEAGEAFLGLTANGIAIPYATTKATIGTASTEVHTIFLTGIVRVLPNAPVTIAISNGGVPVTATTTNLKAIKIG